MPWIQPGLPASGAAIRKSKKGIIIDQTLLAAIERLREAFEIADTPATPAGVPSPPARVRASGGF